jgi:hypothetical protein
MESRPPTPQPKPRKPWVKPEYRMERVFETMALACGKTNNSQSGCRSATKKS